MVLTMACGVEKRLLAPMKEGFCSHQKVSSLSRASCACALLLHFWQRADGFLARPHSCFLGSEFIRPSCNRPATQVCSGCLWTRFNCMFLQLFDLCYDLAQAFVDQFFVFEHFPTCSFHSSQLTLTKSYPTETPRLNDP